MLISGGGGMSTLYVRFDSSGVLRDTLPVIKWPDEARMRVSYDREGSWIPNHHGEIVAGFNKSYSIEIRPKSGKWTRIERIGETPIPISEHERRYEDSLSTLSYNNPYSRKTGPLHAVPPTKPAYHHFDVDADDRIWVKRHVPSIERPASDTTHPFGHWYEPVQAWDVLQRDGTYMGRITFPLNTEIFFSRDNAAWGVVEDENGVPFVVRWKIQPSR
jgi:hypothetical protein